MTKQRPNNDQTTTKQRPNNDPTTTQQQWGPTNDNNWPTMTNRQHHWPTRHQLPIKLITIKQQSRTSYQQYEYKQPTWCNNNSIDSAIQSRQHVPHDTVAKEKVCAYIYFYFGVLFLLILMHCFGSCTLHKWRLLLRHQHDKAPTEASQHCFGFEFETGDWPNGNAEAVPTNYQDSCYDFNPTGTGVYCLCNNNLFIFYLFFILTLTCQFCSAMANSKASGTMQCHDFAGFSDRSHSARTKAIRWWHYYHWPSSLSLLFIVLREIVCCELWM